MKEPADGTDGDVEVYFFVFVSITFELVCVYVAVGCAGGSKAPLFSLVGVGRGS